MNSTVISVLVVCVSTVLISVIFASIEKRKAVKDPVSMCFIESYNAQTSAQCVELARVLNKESK